MFWTEAITPYLLVYSISFALIFVASEHGHSHEHGHVHGHGHGHLDPEDYEHEDHRHLYYKPQEDHDHDHEGHGHSHEVHDHAHEGHGHDGHGHEGHGHSHGGHGHLHPDDYEHEDHRHLYYKPKDDEEQPTQATKEHDHHGHSHHEGHTHHDHGKKDESSKAIKDRFALSTWVNALGATFLISAAPYLLLFLIPLDKNTDEQKPFLKILLSFASGGLLGDAFLHLIPHAVSPHSHGEDGGHSHDPSHSHSHGGEGHGHDHDRNMIVGLWVLAGIVAFLIVEKFVRYVKGGHSHSHSHVVPAKDTPKSKDEGEKNEQENTTESNGNDGGDSKYDKSNKEHSHDDSSPDDIKVAGYLNLAADFTHNFTDGLAIGASFLVNKNLGFITTITILLHEVPHEIGDFAILIQSGCSKRKAMLLQLTTATGAMAGTVCGLLAEGTGSSAATLWILPFTAGGFIYIATVSVIPELLEDSKLWQSIKEIFALFIGVFMMVLIAKME